MNDLITYIQSRGHKITLIDSVTAKYSKEILLQKWEECSEGVVFVLFNTNPETFVQSRKNTVYKTIHQIDGPPKFTVGNITVIRKQGELILRDTTVEWEGFDLMREVILHLVSWEEAIKIIDVWKR